MSETQAEKEQSSSWRTWLLALLLLLLLAGGAAWWMGLFNKSTDQVDLSFRGCDQQNRCADFTLYAPGQDYRWTLDKAVFDPIEGAQPDLVPAVAEIMSRAKGAIASGLASREGGSQLNRRLSSCRSLRLADLLAEAAGDSANIYRIALGKYVDAGTQRDDTSIERLVVMAFIMDMDEGTDLSQALKAGLNRQLPPLLAQFAPEIVKQLQFTRYECWNSEFAVTQRDEIRQSCFRENTRTFMEFCGDFQ